MTPDAIVVFSAGAVPYEEGERTRWRTTTYDDRDAFGTLGGRDRVEAAALLAKKYPDACLVTTSRNFTSDLPTLADVYAGELCDLGIARDRIVGEKESINTGTAVQQVVRLATEKGWEQLLFLSSGFQIPRIKAFFERTESGITADLISSESILAAVDEAFAARFAEVQKTPAYKERLAAEARGLAALQAGAYEGAPPEDKRER